MYSMVKVLLTFKYMDVTMELNTVKWFFIFIEVSDWFGFLTSGLVSF